MTPEEKFIIDLDGYIVFKNALNADEIAELNAAIDDGDGSGRGRRCSLWGEPFKKLIDHPQTLPYLLELIGPHVRLDHDYPIFMDQGDRKSGLHGGENGGGAEGHEGDHWYKYRDGIMRNGLCVVSYMLADADEGDGGFACIPGSHKSNFTNNIPADVRSYQRQPHYVVQPAVKAGDALFFTEALVHGTIPWSASHQRRSLLYKYSPGHSAWNSNYPRAEDYGEISERQRRMLTPPSIGKRPRVDDVEA